jgi:hypothetical protein
MLRYIYICILWLLFTTRLFAQTGKLIETSDIGLFWSVYDKVIYTADSAKSVQLIQEEYIEKGSVGLAAIRHYNTFESKDIYHMIRMQQLYLNSIRKSTLNIQDKYATYKRIFDRFKNIYPQYSYPKVYFTIGAMLVGGFNKDDESVIIGTELATATPSSKTDSLNAYIKLFASGNLGVQFIMTHEIVHTQQIHGYLQNMNLAGICIMEGSADFIADLLLERKNLMPYTIYGRKHNGTIKRSFINNKLSSDNRIINDWIYNTSEYVTGKIACKPDLGYYVGYKICESYHNRAKDKKQAIRDILQINYDDKNSVMNFYHNSGYEKPM